MSESVIEIMSQNRLALSAQEYVRKAIANSSEDEVALDMLAQWSAVKTGKEMGYGIEENYPIIRENLHERFNISEQVANEYVARLREYVAQFIISGADIGLVRRHIMEELKREAGNKLRQIMLKKYFKSSSETRKLAFLLLYLIERGLDPKSFEMSLDVLQAFHAAAFEKPYSTDREEELVNIGVLNRTLYASTDSEKHQMYTVSPLISFNLIRSDASNLKIQTDSKNYAQRLFEKKNFQQLHYLDDLGRQYFGVKKYDSIPEDLIPEKKLIGKYESYVAISPFVLQEIRDEIRTIKQYRLEAYKIRVDSSLLALIKGSWPDGKLDLLEPRPGQAFWRVDNEIDPKLYVYLTPWISRGDTATLSSKMDVPTVSTLICLVLNQDLESALSTLKEKISDYGRLVIISLLNQKEPHVEYLSGEKTDFSNAATKQLLRALDPSVHSSELAYADRRPSSDVGRGAQFGSKSDGPRLLIGMQNSVGIYWSPTKERNWNFGIFGEGGSGKTQVIKKILSQLKQLGVPFLVVDFFAEYVSNDPNNPEFGTVIGSTDISINPLELSNGYSPLDQCQKLVTLFKSIYNLSDIQAAHLKHAIRRSYDAKGVFEDEPKSWSNTPPTLQDLQTAFSPSDKQPKEVRELLQKISPALALSLFSRTRSVIPLEKLVVAPIVLDLGALQTNELKALAAEFIFDKIPFFVQNFTNEPRLFIAVDGAPNLFQNDSNSLRLLIEGRRKGLGFIYPYRDPNNLPEIAFNNTATIMTFRQSDSKIAKVTADRLDVEEKVLKKDLPDKFSALARLSSNTDVVKFTAVPYSQK